MNKRVGRYIRRKFHKKRWQQFAFMMACIVVFCTTYALLLPAVTLEKTADCGLEEHQHEKSCYQNQLVCGNKESDGHRHTDSCYQKVLVCGKEVHVHSEDCFHGRILKGTADENISADNTAEEAGQLLLDETEDIEQTAVNEPASGAAMNQEIDPEAEGDGLSFGEEAAAESESVSEQSTAEEAAEEANPLLEETDTAGWEAEISEEQPADGEAVGEAETDSEENAGEEIVGAAETEPEEPSGEETGVAETEPEEPSGGETVEAETESEEPSGEEIGAAEETPSSEPGLTEEQSAEEETAGETETFPEETANVETDQGSETLPEETSDEETEPVEENPEWAAETSEEQSLTEDIATESETLSESTTNEETGPVEENPEGEAERIENQSSAEETAVETETLSEETAPEEIPDKEARATTEQEQVTSEIMTEDGTELAQEAAAQLACQGPDYEVTVTSGVKEGIPKDASLSVSEIMPETPADNTDADYNADTELTYEEYVSRTEEALGIEEDSGYFIRLFDIKIVDAYGEKIKIQVPVNVKIRLIDQKGADISNAQVVHFADETKEADIAEETNGTEKPDSETLSGSETKTATTPSRNAEAASKTKKIKKAAKAEKEKKDKKGDVIQDVTVEAGVLPEDGTTLSFETEGFSVFALVGTTIEKTVLASDGHNYRITATYGAETGIPEDADLAVEEILPTEQDDSGVLSAFDEYVSRIENVLGWEAGSASYVRVFDIKIVDKDDPEVKYQPKDGSKVDVRIELADKDSSEEAATSTQVVHFADGAENGDIIENSTAGQLVSFDALSFSIYAIVDSSKRLQYNFYDGTSLLASEYIKKQDNILQELYDPGVEPEYGQTFVGWAYSPDETNPANIYTIGQLNQQAADKYNSATEELTEINVYAIYDEAWYLRYMDQDVDGNATVLKVVRVLKEAADKNVTIDYSFTPEEGIVFEGWTDVATGQTYQQGATITLDHHVDLYVKLQGRNWLVFDSNAGGPGSGVTYTPPQLLIGSEATTTKPEDPARRGYTFTGWNTKADGTGTWWYRTNGSVNRFGNTLSADTTLYAQWEANDTDYHVVFWMQKATDAAGLAEGAEEYDYVSSERRTAKTGTTVSTTTADRQKGGTANREYGYYFTYNENNSDTTATVDANGTTVLNVYYDRREITYNFSSSTDFTVPSYTGVVDGETVTLTPDGNGGYTYQKTVTETTNLPYTGTRYNTTTVRNNNNPQHYGVVAGRANPVALDRRDSNRWYYDGSYYSWGTQYYGTHYIVSSSGSYGWVDGDMVALNADGTYTTTVTTTTTEPYTGEVTASTTQTRSASFTGLYGSTFSNWPDLGNGRVWTVTIGSGWNAQTLSLPMALTLFDPQAALTPTATQTTVNFTASTYSTGYTMTVYTQTTDGEWVYSDDNVLTTANLGSSGTWYPTETFEGFTVHSYQTASDLSPNGTWTAITSSGSFSYRNNVFLRYSRNKNKIHFISQGSQTTGRTENVVNDVYYDSDLSKYAEGGSDYYEPTNGNEGYYFAGWYADSDCQIPFDFNTKMPDSDITVYAKWDTYRVRVVLVPTVNNAHNDEVELANNQSLSFRMDYNEEVSDANINSSVAKRAGYKLIGWYYSPDFDPNTEIHFPLTVNKDTPGVDMNYQSGDDWDKYGDNDGSHDNVRGILKLYAKWELDVDENSVYVEYDVDDVYRTYDTAGMLQTTIPVDNDKYALTNDNVTFQVAEAPTKYTSGFEFYKWVLLNPDGSESNMEFNPPEMASGIPSSFIYEETITDDLGHTATIKKIRLKAKFNIETEKVTTVTFDGNGGVTNDSAQQESVTESYPINKDFFMKDEDSFVREGYTLLGWAFERENGSKITPEVYKQAIANMTANQLIQAGIYQLGQKVAADNLEVSDENNWNPLENTVYAVWEINTYTVTVKKVVDGETETNKEFSFAASANGDYTISTGDSPFTLVNGSEKPFTKVPYGTVLTFTETPASGYSIKNVDAKQITNPDKTLLQETDYINLEGEDNKPYTIKGDVIITYTNEKAKEQKLRIHKIGNDATSGLAGAKFDLTSNDAEGFINKKGIVSMGGTAPESLGYLPSGDASDGSLFTLPNGTYTLTETKAPQHYDGIAGTVTLNVTGDGISITKVGTDVEAPFEGVAISEKDLNGIYTLTITNTRKLATVTIIKNVIGTNADKDAEYSFKATGLTATQDTFKLHGRQIPDTVEEGATPTQENTKVYTNIPYGTVFSVTEDSTYTDFDTTIAISNEETPVTAPRLTTGNVTVDGDVTITYTNTRNKQPVKVFKYETGTSPEKPLSDAVFSLTGPEGSDVSYTGLTTNSDGYLVYEENIVLELPVNTGTYTLIIGDGNTTFTVSPGLVTGAVAETELIEGEEIPSVVFIIKIQNSAGVELPSTGGPGTSLIHLLGIMLTGLAGTRLVMRKRRKAA